MLYHEKALLDCLVEIYSQCNLRKAHDENVGCHVVELTTAFLYSDELYFL